MEKDKYVRVIEGEEVRGDGSKTSSIPLKNPEGVKGRGGRKRKRTARSKGR